MPTNSPPYSATNPGSEGWTTQRAAADGIVGYRNLTFGGDAPAFASNRYYLTSSPSAASTANNLGNNTLRLVPWRIYNNVTLNRIGAEITAAGEAASTLRLGIYADNTAGYPGALLLDAGTIAADSATTQEITINLTLSAGLYWIGGAVQGAATTPPTVRCGSGWFAPIDVADASMPSSGAGRIGYSHPTVTGALPATFTSTVSAIGVAPRVFVRTA